MTKYLISISRRIGLQLHLFCPLTNNFCLLLKESALRGSLKGDVIPHNLLQLIQVKMQCAASYFMRGLVYVEFLNIHMSRTYWKLTKHTGII